MKKQPDKITAYYYRAANKQTDLNLDNQMHRLLSLAQENGTDTYMFFVDNGYNGLTAERPAFQNLLAAIHENRVQKSLSYRLTDFTAAILQRCSSLMIWSSAVFRFAPLQTAIYPFAENYITALSTPTAVLPRKAVNADDGIYLSELEAAGQFKQ